MPILAKHFALPVLVLVTWSVASQATHHEQEDEFDDVHSVREQRQYKGMTRQMIAGQAGAAQDANRGWPGSENSGNTGNSIDQYKYFNQYPPPLPDCPPEDVEDEQREFGNEAYYSANKVQKFTDCNPRYNNGGWNGGGWNNGGQQWPTTTQRVFQRLTQAPTRAPNYNQEPTTFRTSAYYRPGTQAPPMPQYTTLPPPPSFWKPTPRYESMTQQQSGYPTENPNRSPNPYAPVSFPNEPPYGTPTRKPYEYPTPPPRYTTDFSSEKPKSPTYQTPPSWYPSEPPYGTPTKKPNADYKKEYEYPSSDSRYSSTQKPFGDSNTETKKEYGYPSSDSRYSSTQKPFGDSNTGNKKEYGYPSSESRLTPTKSPADGSYISTKSYPDREPVNDNQVVTSRFPKTHDNEDDESVTESSETDYFPGDEGKQERKSKTQPHVNPRSAALDTASFNFSILILAFWILTVKF